MVCINNSELHIFSDSNNLYKAIANDFMQRAKNNIQKKGTFNVVLSGGSTPKKLFSLLSQEPYKSGVTWDKIRFFFGDERYVPKDSPDNNFFTAKQYLFNHVPIMVQHIFPVPTECKDPHKAALEYAETIRDLLKVKNNEIPKFDLLYLGLGSDAHTASLMPGTDLVKIYSEKIAEKDQKKIVAADWIAALNMYRITFTPPLINNSERIVFLVEGQEKAKAVWEILEGPHDPVSYPAQLIEAKSGKIIWFMDESAARQLETI
jgi:6-phosphogluconolactonase